MFSDENNDMVHQALEFFERKEGKKKFCGTRDKVTKNEQGVVRKILDSGRIEETTYRVLPGGKSEKHGLEFTYLPNHHIQVDYFEMGQVKTSIEINMNNFKKIKAKT